MPQPPDTPLSMTPVGHVRSANKTQKSSAGRQAERVAPAPRSEGWGTIGPEARETIGPAAAAARGEAGTDGRAHPGAGGPARPGTDGPPAPSDVIELLPGRGFEQALQDLDGFTHAWILFAFHEARGWKPMVRPPRGIARKVGVFASRAPYRPNPVGLSLVPVLRVQGLKVWIGDSDLLDGTPVLDIKPYVATTDALPEAGLGWMEFLRAPALRLEASPAARAGFDRLRARGFDLESIVRKQLERDPFAKDSKRVRRTGRNRGVFAYRLWRIEFEVKDQALHIENIECVFHKDVDDALKARLSPFETELYLSFHQNEA